MNIKIKAFLKQDWVKSIVAFTALLFFFHFSWKLSIDGDSSGNYMYLFDRNVTPEWFTPVVHALTKTVGWFVRLFPNTDTLIVGDNYLTFSDGRMTNIIIWGCTGIKQMFIFCGLMLLYRCISVRNVRREGWTLSLSVRFNPYWDKLWYIPLGCLILSVYNVIRIGTVVLLTRDHPERFDSLHDGILRYIYYGIIFLLWVVWEEYYAKKKYNYYEHK